VVVVEREGLRHEELLKALAPVRRRFASGTGLPCITGFLMPLLSNAL